MVLDLTEPVDRVRLSVADTSDVPFLPDSVYEYLLDKHANNESAATKEAAYLILGQLAFGTDERLDRLEFHGSQRFQQYKTFLEEVIKNPNGALSLAGIYAGGISKADIAANNCDPDVVGRAILPCEDNDEFRF